MPDEEFEEEAPELDDDALDEEDLDVEDPLVDDADDVVDLLDDELVDASPEVEVPVAVVTDATAAGEEDDDEEGVVDLDEELHPDDVEAPLDTLLQERTASATLEDDEDELEEEEGDGDDRVDGPARIVPRRPDEFLCQSCFLLLPLRRLADPARQYCDDCA
ncbi:MAG TPA: DUF4193 family protein [Acidimicrobiia bacterium]|jgi:hypothetical protein